MTRGLAGDSGGGPASAEHFRLLVDIIRDYAIFMLDPQGRVASWNAGAEAIKGYRPEEIIGSHISTFYTEEDKVDDKPARLLRDAAVEGRVEDEGWRIRKDGTRFWADVVITALRDSHGELVGFAKVTRDLTERRQAANKLREAEELLEATLYSIGDGVLATDADGRITIANRVAEDLTGWSESEAVGHPIDEVFDIFNEHTGDKAINPVVRVLQEGIVVGLANHTGLRSRDGTWRPIADSGAPIRDAQGRTRGAVLVFRDVTEERRSELALRESEERFRLMIESVRDYAIFMLDPDGRVATWNSGAERIKGYSADEIVGSHFSRFFVPEDIASEKPALELDRAASDGRFEVETWRVRKDGSRFWANVVISAVRDASGMLVGFTKVTRDLTERRRAENERVRLAQTQEAAHLRDEFLAIASHELKTPLTALQLQLQGLRDRLADDAKLTGKIDRASRAGDRLADLIGTLLDVSRITSGQLTLKLERFDVVDAVREVVDRLRESANQAGCHVSLDTSESVVGLWDRLRVEQTLSNLLANAIRYAPGRPITLRVEQDRGAATIQVRDHGPGIPAESLDRIFGRYERATSSASGGMGLGLYVARQVVDAHGGRIEAEDVDGQGACFTVRLPLEPPGR